MGLLKGAPIHAAPETESTSCARRMISPRNDSRAEVSLHTDGPDDGITF